MLPMKPVAELLKERAAAYELDRRTPHSIRYTLGIDSNALLFGQEMSILAMLGPEAFSISSEDLHESDHGIAIEEWFVGCDPTRSLEITLAESEWIIDIYERVVLPRIPGIYTCVNMHSADYGGSAGHLFFAPVVAG